MRAIPLTCLGLLSLAAGCGGPAPATGSHTTSGHTTGSSTTTGAGGATGSGGTGGTGGTGASGQGGTGGTTTGGTGGTGTGSTSTSTTPPSGPVPVPKTNNTKIYVHMMPWFETPASNNGTWGIHWTMTNQNPNVIGSSGQRQIASYYYPMIGPYASGDHDVIEYQLLLMKYAGVDGLLIDWPGTANAFDYVQNVHNAQAIMAQTASVGLEFGVVYEDADVAAANVGNQIGQGQEDLSYAASNYFGQSNYIRVNGAPLFLVFGPQTFTTPSDWDQIFAPLSTKPTFLTLWYQSAQAGSSASGEFAWIYTDFITGLTNFYNNHPLDVKLGVAYPGFNAFYAAGGWPGPTWQLPYNGTSTFSQTIGMGTGSVDYVQIATWNDYGEGTMIEPTAQFGYGMLTTLQQTVGVTYGQNPFDVINTLYNERKQYAGNSAKQAQLDQVFDDLVSLQVSAAASLL